MAPSFGAIFFNNCFQSGLLPIVLDETIIENFMNQARESKMGPNFTINLKEQTITPLDGKVEIFHTEQFRREALLAGLDDLGMTTQRISKIDAFQNKDRIRGRGCMNGRMEALRRAVKFRFFLLTCR